MSKDTKAKAEEIMESKVLWYPDSKKNTQMDRFRAQVNRDYGLNLANYNDLYQWSVENYADFWAEVWRFCGIISSEMYEEVVDVSKRISDVPEWFRGSRLNYAENLLKHTDQEKVALYAAAEGREEIIKVTFGELRREVARFAASMRKMGIKAGDRVVGYLPNGVHAVEAMLAAASIGAIWSSTSVDFGVNGTLIQHLKEHVLHGNMMSSDVIIYYTTTGWMMWNWLVSSLAVGASVVLYDGSPLVPTPDVLWNLVDQLGITIFGTGAKWLSVLEERNLKPGGTDIISCFMGQNFTVPVYRGEIQARNLGMAVESWSPEGKAVWGESGELVCLKPIPCQPTHFWNDDNGNKYRKAYFSTFPENVHGVKENLT
ncbi:hypothetical protein PGIGA_G00151730 [Pangasianodon gigas]|uniref:Uncharacterized protein n=1 Tax=Pangasianodon gigas TaxID=30993 RepID=A0ACC5XP11_PANGG|nr:hypothetical protein [Pangasianodon gigas]